MRKSQQKKVVLIVRLSSLGDVVMASPIAEVFKRYNPNAKIVWAVQAEHAEALSNNPHIDELFIWDKEHWKGLWQQRKFSQLWQEIKKTKKQLNQYHFELALDLQGLFKSGFLSWLSGAKERIGIGSREGSYWFMHKMVSRDIANRMQMASEYRYLVNQMGYNDGDWKINIHISNNAHIKAQSLLEANLAPNEPYAVICPFAERAQKQWPNDSWQQLALRIRGRYQLKTIILGAKHDGTRGQQLARHFGGINLAGQAGIQEAASIIKGASLVVGVENGLTHISQALPPPSIALFGPSCPYIYNGNENSKVLYLDRFCSPCTRKPICGGTFECMTEITPDRVLTELKVLIRNTETNIQLEAS